MLIALVLLSKFCGSQSIVLQFQATLFQPSKTARYNDTKNAQDYDLESYKITKMRDIAYALGSAI